METLILQIQMYTKSLYLQRWLELVQQYPKLNKISGKSNVIILRNENIHNPFLFRLCNSHNPIVEVYDFKNNSQGELIKSYPISEHYMNNFIELLLNEGVVLDDENNCICTTDSYNQVNQ